MCLYRSSCCEMEHICYQEIFSPHGYSGAFKLTYHLIKTSPSLLLSFSPYLPIHMYALCLWQIVSRKRCFVFIYLSFP